jgi:hypothetical protein
LSRLERGRSALVSRQNGAENNFESWSYGKLNVIPTVTSEVFTMPHNEAYYDNRGGAMSKIGSYYLTGTGLGSHTGAGRPVIPPQFRETATASSMCPRN